MKSPLSKGVVLAVDEVILRVADLAQQFFFGYGQVVLFEVHCIELLPSSFLNG